MARELERRWEAAFRRWGQVEQEYTSRQRSALSPLSGDEVEQVRRLAADLPALWHADTTTPVDRKRLLRLAVAEVTITVHAAERTADISLLWSGGARTSHRVSCPPPGWHLRTAQRVLTLIRELAGEHADHHIAARLNAWGCRRARAGPGPTTEWLPCVTGTRSPHAAPSTPEAGRTGPTGSCPPLPRPAGSA